MYMLVAFKCRNVLRQKSPKVISNTLGAKGVIVVCRAEHLCMKMRGVEKQDSSTTTIDYDGVFAEDTTLRQEFLSLIQN